MCFIFFGQREGKFMQHVMLEEGGRSESVGQSMAFRVVKREREIVCERDR